jgi:hypothetical protein
MRVPNGIHLGSSLSCRLAFEFRHNTAHEMLMRVRLLHAALRHYLPRSDRWGAVCKASPDCGTPLNQQDLAITLAWCSFMNMIVQLSLLVPTPVRLKPICLTKAYAL